MSRPLDPTTPAADTGPPTVSVVLPVRNEGRHLQACLERLIDQDYPRDRVEIIVVDGRSDDATHDVLERVMSRHPNVRLRVLDNPDRIVPTALNIGIRAAVGEVIVRMDGHSIPERTHLTACVRALRSSGAANVGGGMRAEGTTPFGRAVALVMRHRLSAGDARYRTGGRAGDVDTVPFGAFRRDVFDRVGLFDESMVRNQDYEFNARLRAAGERVYFDPSINFVYAPRETPGGLWRQFFQYGWWRVETIRRHPSSVRWRQLVPPIFVGTFTTALLLAPWFLTASWALVAITAAYLGTVATVSLAIARSDGTATPLNIALGFAIIHLAFGTGFLTNLLTGGRLPYRSGPPAVPRNVTSPTRADRVAQGHR